MTVLTNCLPHARPGLALRSAHIHTLTNPDQLRTYLQHPTPHHA